jgi:hypothetical protein
VSGVLSGINGTIFACKIYQFLSLFLSSFTI